MPLPIAYSPCPNDTFLFSAWAEGMLPHSPPITPHLADIEQLNAWALERRFPLTKVSIGILPKLQPDYLLLPVGAALGFGCGPLLIAKEPQEVKTLLQQPMAVPGENTTAYLLLCRLVGVPEKPLFCTYDAIPQLLANATVASGLIIHETRFTFAKMGFRQVLDLGALWHEKMGLPLPLGGLVAHRDLGESLIKQLIAALQDSLRWARANPLNRSYILKHSQEKDLSVIRNHIDLYVNDETLRLSEKGKQAIETLLHPLRLCYA